MLILKKKIKKLNKNYIKKNHKSIGCPHYIKKIKLNELLKM